MKNLYVVLASQDFYSANHKGLWEELSLIPNNNVLVMNIPADLIVTPLRGKFNRIKESQNGVINITNSLKIVRPLFFIRPEISNNLLNKFISKKLWKIIKDEYNLNDIKNIRFIYYNSFWAKIINEFPQDIKSGYYLFDEVRLNGNDNSINKKRSLEDEYACKKADHIFLMSEKLIENRKNYEHKMILVGNGSSMHKTEEIKKIENSVGFIGNFRNWIDEDLLTNLIKEKKDFNFYFIGTIENDMQEFFDTLINRYPNVFYGGVKDKNQIPNLYQLFNVIIIPYKNSDFIRATRPIKIVESISTGTPVVTVPIDGYKENNFIKFSKNYADFSVAIDELTIKGIDTSSDEYKNFVTINSWKSKALIIDKCFKEV